MRVGLTVGSGIRPDLLTLPVAAKALAGSCLGDTYRRWGISPRPEDACRRTGARSL